jgi:uncharacterized YccA/Bax inhibitor family protein
MESRNPVLRRATAHEPQPGGAGFAYDEGRSAYAAAAGLETASAPTADELSTMYATPGAGTGRLGIDDVIIKTALCFVVLLPGAAIGWVTAPTMPWLLWVASLAGLGLGLVNVFKKQVVPALVLAYAFVQGIFLGGISYFFNEIAEANGYSGIVQQAVLGTLVAFAVMLTLYRTRIIKVNGTFMKIMMVSMISYLVIAVVSFIASLFGVGGGWGFYGVGTWGLLLCAAGVLLASFSLAMDFESINQAIRYGLPERESWRLAFGLLVTLIWLYLEILRLLAILSGRE